MAYKEKFSHKPAAKAGSNWRATCQMVVMAMRGDVPNPERKQQTGAGKRVQHVRSQLRQQTRTGITKSSIQRRITKSRKSVSSRTSRLEAKEGVRLRS